MTPTKAAAGISRATGVDPLWQPDDLATLEAWYRADDLAGSEGEAISTWPDKSPNGWNLTGAAGERPVLRLNAVNGKKAVDFDGADDLMSSSLVPGPFSGTDKPITGYVVVLAESAPAGTEAVFSLGSSLSNTPLVNLALDGAVGKFRAFLRDDSDDPAFGAQRFTSAYSPSTWYWLGIRWDPAGDRIDIYSSSLGTDAGSTTPADTITLNRFSVGAIVRTVISNYADIRVAELMLYSEALGAGDRANLEAYLDTEYGL